MTSTKKSRPTTQKVFIAAARHVARRDGGKVEAIYQNRRFRGVKLSFKDGTTICTRGTTISLNERGIPTMMRDKFRTIEWQKIHNIPGLLNSHLIKKNEIAGFLDTSRQEAQETYQSLLSFINEVGYPFFLKPNTGRQGRDVYCVDDQEMVRDLITKIVVKRKEDFLAQESCVGKGETSTEYRLIILQGKVVLALRRNPLSTVGDGERKVLDLIKEELAELRQNGRKIKVKPRSPKIRAQLKRQGLTFNSTPDLNQYVILLANKNLSDGASAIECTSEIADEYADLARQIYAAGINYTAADIIKSTRDGITASHIIELNSYPGYAHFLRSAPHHPQKVAQVFVAMFRAAHQQALEKRIAMLPNVSSICAPPRPLEPNAGNDNNVLPVPKVA